MRIKISFDEKAVVSRGEDFVEIECKPHESPKLPAFVHVYEDGAPAEETRGYYLTVNEAGSLKASRHD